MHPFQPLLSILTIRERETATLAARSEESAIDKLSNLSYIKSRREGHLQGKRRLTDHCQCDVTYKRARVSGRSRNTTRDTN